MTSKTFKSGSNSAPSGIESIVNMENFIHFLDECKEEYNHHQQNVKKSYEIGWKPILEQYRNKKSLPDAMGYRNIELSGMDEYKLTDEEAFFVLSFTGSYSSWINLPLRNGYPLETKCKEFFANNLEKTLEKLPSYNDRYVFRMDTPTGSKSVVLNWFEANIEKVITIPYFLSTAKENYENTEITWRIKTLTNDSKGKNLELLTNNIPEEEVLFKRNALFKIKEIDHQKGIIEMQEVLQSDNPINLIGFYFER